MNQCIQLQKQRLKEPGQVSAINREIMMEIVFGSPSKNCEGHGICRMMEIKYMAGMDIKCPHVPVFLSWDRQRSSLMLRLPKKFITNQKVARHFYKGLFKVTEPYKVPARFSRELGRMESVKITPGTYPVIETDEDLIVIFDGHMS